MTPEEFYKSERRKSPKGLISLDKVIESCADNPEAFHLFETKRIEVRKAMGHKTTAQG